MSWPCVGFSELNIICRTDLYNGLFALWIFNFPLSACSKYLEYVRAKGIMLKIVTDTLLHGFKEMARNKLQLVSLGPWLNLTGRCRRALNWTTNLRPEDPFPPV